MSHHSAKKLPRWLFPLIGCCSFVWFLVRVIPKPSRATYPCQRAAFPLTTGFIIWLGGLLGSVTLLTKLRQYLNRFKYSLCVILILAGAISIYEINANSKTIDEAKNTPIGTAQGLYPGRVVWAHNPDATNWNNLNTPWWSEQNTNQKVIDEMFSQAISSLTNTKNAPEAWNSLFCSFNQSYGRGKQGYQKGQTIAIKINENNQNNPFAKENESIDALPQMVLTVLRQLVNQAKVNQAQIIVYDATRPISDPVYQLCHKEFKDVKYLGGDGLNDDLMTKSNIDWVPNAITFSNGEVTDRFSRSIPRFVLKSDYLINLAILKAHNAVTGVTLCGKNHYGTLRLPGSLHGYTNSGMGTYTPQVDLMGHQQVGGKTLLYILDGIYGALGYGSTPTKWQMPPFNDDWVSSLFLSQDPVAIDSVGYDFLKAENAISMPNADNYLHEAAQANQPPSKTFYDPEKDGVRMKSLGVHEHWNNVQSKQYSRNLNPEQGKGVELIKLSLK